MKFTKIALNVCLIDFKRKFIDDISQFLYDLVIFSILNASINP